MSAEERADEADAVDDGAVPREAADETGETPAAATPSTDHRTPRWRRIVAFAVLPVVAVVLAGAAGYLTWQDLRREAARTAATESVAVARETTAAILSYRAASVEADLNAVRDRLTGEFLQSYTTLINDVVIPGAKEQQISAAAQVAAAASVSATPTRAVVLAFVNQTVTMGTGAPTASASSVRVTLERVDGRWLVSGFDPI